MRSWGHEQYISFQFNLSFQHGMHGVRGTFSPTRQLKHIIIVYFTHGKVDQGKARVLMNGTIFGTILSSSSSLFERERPVMRDRLNQHHITIQDMLLHISSESSVLCAFSQAKFASFPRCTAFLQLRGSLVRLSRTAACKGY